MVMCNSKKNIFLLLLVFLFSFCNDNSEQSKDKQQKIQKDTIKKPEAIIDSPNNYDEDNNDTIKEFNIYSVALPFDTLAEQSLSEKEEVDYEKIDYHELQERAKNNLQKLGFGQYEFENAAPSICDTSYFSISGKSYNLNITPIKFAPYLLVVSENILYLLDSKLSVIYGLKFPFKIHTASWSPFRNTELFILGREEIKYKKDAYTQYLDEGIFNLHLYSLDISSMQITQLATFYDKSLKLSRYYYGDAPTFFGELTFMLIDKEKKLIYYDCLHPYDPDGSYYYLLTYTYNITTNKCSLTKKTEENIEHNIGNYVERASSGLIQLDRLNTDSGYISVPLNNTKLKIETSYLYKAPINMQKEMGDCLEILYRLAFPESSQNIVFSPAKVCGMDVTYGNIYLLNSKGKFLKVLIKNCALDYHLSIREASNGNLIFGNTYRDTRSLDDLYLFDTKFQLKKKFTNVSNYELR